MVYSAQFQPWYGKVVEAHGILGALAWVIFFPVGAILIRAVPGSKSWLIHAAAMFFALSLLTANVGMGIWQAYTYNEYHQIIGLLVFSLAWLQPVGGFVHHFLFTKYERRTIVSFMHISIGRAIITLGVINGGLGLMLAGDATRGEIIAYGTIAGIIWVSYFTIAFISEDRREAARTEQLRSGKVFED